MNLLSSLMTIVVWLLSLYAVGVIVFLLLKFSIGERWNVIGFLNSFYPILLLPSLPSLVIAILLSNGLLAVALLIPTLVLLITYGPRFFIRPIDVAPGTPQISVLTYNVHDEYECVAQIAALIREANADVVACQELDPGAAAYFAKELIADYPYQALHTDEGAHTGQGVISRFPLLADEYWRNMSFALPLMMGHQRTQIDYHGTPITFYNAHPIHPGMAGKWYDASVRGKEIDIILARAIRDAGPVIILGDFNMADQSDDYRRITRTYLDTFREAGRGLGLTFPDFSQPQARTITWAFPWLPRLLRLDFVFHNQYLQGLEARVWSHAGGSDHHPVFVWLALRH